LSVPRLQRALLAAAGYCSLAMAPALAASTAPATGAPPPPYELYVQPSWVLPPPKPGARDEMIFRRYAFSADLTDMPNFMAYACQKSGKYDNYMTIEVPQNYPIQTFKRTADVPKLDIRFTVNDQHTYIAAAEYLHGKIYFDRTAAQAEPFDAVLNAKDLVVEFGAGDLLRFHLLDNVEEFLKGRAPTAVRSPDGEERSFVDTATMLALCAKYRQGQAGQ